MTIMLMGDHYVWYCPWCDSRNLTSWVKMEHRSVCCSACQKRFKVSREGNLVTDDALSGKNVTIDGMPAGTAYASTSY